jgi:C-terminal processing protease CtpA/Prc
MKPWSGDAPVRLTDYNDRPVLFLSVSNMGRLCFVQDFRIRIMDYSEMTGEYSSPHTVNLDLESEPKRSQEVRLDINGNVSEMEISPLGTNLAIIARGELFVVPLHDPDEPAPLGDARYWEAVRVTETPAREQYVAWHPDGDRIVLSSDKDGNFELYEIDLRNFEWTRLTDTPKDEINAHYSPDGSMLAFYYGNDQLETLNLETHERKIIAGDLFVFQPWIGRFEWSPDGKWIAYSGSDQIYNGEVYIVPSDGSTDPVNITLHHDNDVLGGWTPDGEKIYFLSRRDFESGLEGYGWWWSGGRLYAIDLQHTQQPSSDFIVLPDENIEGESSDEVAPDDETTEESGEDTSGVEVKIDFDRIDERVRRIANMQGGSEHVAISPDGSTYIFEANVLGNWALWKVGSEGGSPTQIATLPDRPNDIEWLPDGSGVLYQVSQKVYYWEKDSGTTVQVPTFGRLTVDLVQERREMVYEAGRLLGSHFYDEHMHGYDWNEIVNLYAPLVEEAATGEEFSTLMRMMFGELDASHLNAYTAGSNEGVGSNIAEIGLEFDLSTQGPGLLVNYVLPRGPADYDESRVNVGEWVLAMNGTEVSPANNYWSLLDDAACRSTVLTVASDQDGANSREVTIIPISRWEDSDIYPGWSTAAYEAWVEKNRAAVDELSGGRVGYVHIRFMGGSCLERFAREMFEENYDKEAVIIDIRWNGGGNIHEFLLDILSRPQFGWSRPRDMEMIQQPGQRWGKPTVLLINERSSSDSEIFPAGFRALGLGTIIGETTLGAVIGTEEYRLIDGTTGIRLPIEGWFYLNGTNLENDGVEPDIRVVNDLNHIRDGIDDQLIYAARYLLDGLGE